MTIDENVEGRVAKVIDWSLRVLIVLIIFVVGWLAQSINGNLKCQRDINEKVIARTRNLSDITNQERDAIRRIENSSGDLWDAVAANQAKPGSVSPAEISQRFSDYRQAIATYRSVSAKADEERAKNPPPALPSSTC